MAVSREQLIFDAFANTSRAESNFVSLGRKAGAAGDDVSALARRLDEISKKSAAARVKLEGDKDAQARLDRLDLKMALVGGKIMRPNVTIEGAARAALEIGALDAELDGLKDKSVQAAGKSGIGALIGGGGIQGGGMGALVAAGVALSPVIATLSVGLAGFGAAAAGVAAPILKAAHAAGGLQANMAKLDPEQRKVARGLLGLGQRFDVFEKALQPQVLGVFNQGIRLAGHLLHDVEPVAAATGKALGTLLGQIDAEFQSGTWQKFFTWMGTQAGPDIKLVGDAFINLMDALPGLLKALQPVSLELLHQVDVASVLIRDLSQLGDNTTTAGHAAATAAKSHNILADAFRNTLQFMAPELPLAQKIQHWLLKQGDAAAHSAQGLSDAGHAAVVAGPAFFDLNRAVTRLNTSMTTLVGNLLTLQGDNVAWRQSMQAAKHQLDSNSAGLAGNSKNALANKAAVIQTTNAAITFAGEQLTLHKNLGQASDTIQKQIGWLQGLHDKSQLVKDEIKALRREEELLNRQRINQTIKVQGLGQWSVSQSLAPGTGHRRAKGGRVPGYGGGDRWPALLEGGEAIVPKHLTPMVAPFLRAHKVPGFAAGGLIPTHTGLGGMVPWIKTDDAATIRLIDQAVVKATVAGMRAAQSAAASFAVSGALGGDALANQALAKRMFPWGASQWPPFVSLVMAESGFSRFARNPSSGAYGIAQALPPTKYPLAGQAAGGSHAGAQLSWMFNYIAQRYGTPAGAWAHEVSAHWYDQGGWLHPGATLAVNNTGRPERVLPPGGGGGTQTVVLEFRGGSEGRLTAVLLEVLRHEIRIRGGNTQQVLGRN